MANALISDLPARSALATDELEVQATGAGASARVTAASLAILNVNLVTGSVDPSAGAGVAASIGTLYARTTNGTIWSKTTAPNTGWKQLAFVP